MKKIIVISFFFLLLHQISFAQKDVKTLIENAKNAYYNESYQETLNIVNEIKPLFKSTPPPTVQSLEILSRCKIIESNPLADYYILDTTRKLIVKFLSNPNSKKNNDYYNEVLQEKNVLDNYPKDKATFDAKLEELQKEKELKIALKEKEAAEERARKEASEERARKEAVRQDSLRLVKIEEDRIRKQNDAIQAEKNRIAEAETQREVDRLAREYAEKENIRKEKEAKIERRRLKSFSNLGFQSGEIAKYGLLYECGGNSFIGFHMSARTSLTSDSDILNGVVKANKTEIDLGPNFKIFKRVYFNLGAGYGFYNFINRNDYSGMVNMDKMGYVEASTGLMIRINRIININGGASFIDIDKDFYKPEITFGISFNLKGEKKY